MASKIDYRYLNLDAPRFVNTRKDLSSQVGGKAGYYSPIATENDNQIVIVGSEETFCLHQIRAVFLRMKCNNTYLKPDEF